MSILSTGGGGGLPTGWTQSGNPATVNAHSGELVGLAELDTVPVGVVNADVFSTISPSGGGVGYFQFSATAVTVLQCASGDNTAATYGLEVSDASFNDILAVRGDGHIGFFGGTPAAQQTLTSATATPEQIALALKASTLTGGT